MFMPSTILHAKTLGKEKKRNLKAVQTSILPCYSSDFRDRRRKEHIGTISGKDHFLPHASYFHLLNLVPVILREIQSDLYRKSCGN